eukprot:13949352-Alexandrium_andersonii.AAC.1
MQAYLNETQWMPNSQQMYLNGMQLMLNSQKMYLNEMQWTHTNDVDAPQRASWEGEDDEAQLIVNAKFDEERERA